MNGERILNVSPYYNGRLAFLDMAAAFGADNEHILIGSVESVREMEELARNENKPTIVCVTDFLESEELEAVCKRAKELFPGVTVVTWGVVDQVVEGVDRQFGYSRPQEMFDYFTSLKR